MVSNVYPWPAEQTGRHADYDFSYITYSLFILILTLIISLRITFLAALGFQQIAQDY